MQFHVGGADRDGAFFYGREFYGAETDSHSTTTPGRTDGRNNNASEGDTANIAAKKVGDVQWDDFNATV